MKKMFATILLVIVAVAAVLAIVIAMRPAEFRVVRTTTMSAPASVVFAQVNDFHKWGAWSPWEKIDPAMKRTYDGAAAGTGAKYAWAGNSKAGEGNMTITESKPGELIRIKLEFLKPFAASNEAEFTFAPQGNQTLVTWTMTGKNTFITKAMQMVMSMDKMVGGDFEKGLAEMKTVSEAAAKATASADNTADREIVSTRMLDAPRDRVFAAWTDPAVLAKWWGPKGFTNTFEEFDLRPGGAWRFTMHGPDGTDYPQESVFIEVVKPERIVFDHVSEHGFRAAITFTAQSGKTLVTFRMIHATATECDKVKPFVVEGNEQNFDRLEGVLASMV